MRKYLYMSAIYLIAGLFVIVAFVMSINQSKSQDEASVAGLDQTRELFIKAVNNPKNRQNFELLCDKKKNYLVNHEGNKLPSLQYLFIGKSKTINNRTYYYDLNYDEATTIYNEYHFLNSEFESQLSDLKNNCLNYL